MSATDGASTTVAPNVAHAVLGAGPLTTNPASRVPPAPVRRWAGGTVPATARAELVDPSRGGCP